MTPQDTAQRPALRSQRLNQITNEPHQKLDALVKAHKPFETRENFARFVVAQYLFQAELQALYTDPALQEIVPDLPQRCRAEHAKADLADLNTEVPAPVAGAVNAPSVDLAEFDHSPHGCTYGPEREEIAARCAAFVASLVDNHNTASV